MLRKSPERTPALLAANRANSLKSTGPRTPRGKARVSLNALKHGRYAARSAVLRERLVRAGCREANALYGRLRTRIAEAFGTENPRSWRRVDRLATDVWCLATRRDFGGTKPESAFDSESQTLRNPNHREIALLRCRVEDRWRGIGLSFWVQRRRYLTFERLIRVLREQEVLKPRRPDEGLEDRVRSRCYRLGRPNYEQRLRFALDRDGNFHPEWYALWRRTWRDLRRRGLLSNPFKPGQERAGA